jgi:hypothetical protein
MQLLVYGLELFFRSLELLVHGVQLRVATRKLLERSLKLLFEGLQPFPSCDQPDLRLAYDFSLGC